MRDKKFSYHVYNSPLMGPTPNRKNPIHAFTCCFSKTCLPIYTHVSQVFAFQALLLNFYKRVKCPAPHLLRYSPNIWCIIQNMKFLIR